MATNVLFECHGHGPDGRSSVSAQATISLADVSVNTTPTAVGTFTTATVAANLQNQIYISQSQAITSSIKPGWYHKVSASVFRKDA